MDKLDGKISEDFWQRKQADWEAEELQDQIADFEGLNEPTLARNVCSTCTGF